MNASTALLKAMIARADYLDGIERAVLLKILPILEAAHESVLGKIAKTRGKYTAEWLAEMAADLQEIYDAATTKAYGAIRGDLEKLAQAEGAWIGGEVGQAAAGISFTAPAPSLLWAAVEAMPASNGATLEQLFQALSDTSRAAAYDAIAAGMIEGETVDQLTARLRGEVVKKATWRRIDGKRTYVPGVYSGGAIEGVTTRGAEMIARTAVMHVSNAARDQFYKANEDIIKGYQYVATLDLRTCLVCGNDDGRVFATDEPRPQLPRHPGDRCLYVPVLKSWQELGVDGPDLPRSTRASMDGQVADTVTFADRLKTASRAQRVEMLGKSRADLYDAGVPLDAMVEAGRALTLDEIAAKRRGNAA